MKRINVDDDNDGKTSEEPRELEEPQRSYTPSSRVKRLLAWVGVALVALLVVVYSYSMATGSLLNW